MQRPSPNLRSEEYFANEIFEETFYPNLKRFVRRRHAGANRMSSNMVDGNQQKHMLPSFATKARIYSSKNLKTLKKYFS